MDTKPGVSTGGIKCPQCFVRRAWDKGLTDVNWELVPVPKGFSAKVPLEGRVVPTYTDYSGEPRELLRQWYATFIGTDGRWKVWREEQRPSSATPSTPAHLGESALLAETPTGGDRVGVHPVRSLDLLALFAVLASDMVNGRSLGRLRVVVRSHDGLLRRLSVWAAR
jgi:hypothetical protein